MPKKYIKTISIASTFILAFLGSAGTSWGMWEEITEQQKKIMCIWHGTGHNLKNTSLDRQPCWINHGNDKYNYENCSRYRAHYPIAQYFAEHVKDCPHCYLKANKMIGNNKKIAVLERIENTINIIPVQSNQSKLKAEEINERLQNLETTVLNATTQKQENREKDENRKQLTSELFQNNEKKSNNNNTKNYVKNNINSSTEEGGSLISTVKYLRKAKIQYEEQIKNLNEEAEESTEIIKEMMKIIGIKTAWLTCSLSHLKNLWSTLHYYSYGLSHP